MLKKGFTLIELMVSVAIFSVVMVIALGALLAMSEADRKAQTLKTVINNLNFGLESMSRTIRTGYDYKCGDPVTGGDCTTGSGSTYLAITAADGSKVAYCLNAGSIRRQITSGSLNASCSSSVFQPLTASEVVIEKLNFFVSGSSRSDTVQPRVTILVSGYVNFKEGQRSQFNIQTMATQRVYDIYKRDKRGFTLIETLVAILILMTAISGPLTIAYKGFAAATVAKDQITAFFLAQDALEYIRFARDTNRLGSTNWTTGTISLSNCTSPNTCYLDSTNQFPSSATGCNGACPVMRYDTTTGTYQYDTNDTLTIFRRTISIVSINANEILASTTVTWAGANGVNRSVTLLETLLNWP